MKCVNPYKLVNKVDGSYKTFGCGKCSACKAARISEWCVRLTHEAMYHECTLLVTLTYADEFYPKDMSLDKKAFSDFMKRLRRNIEPRRIKYYACGEYGKETGRAHYHAILFGMYKEDKSVIEKSWIDVKSKKQLGMIDVKIANEGAFRYVTKYVWDRDWETI